MNEEWLKILYDRHYDMLYRLASNRLTLGMGFATDVQDVLQEVFLLAAKKKICNHPKPEGWLVITTVNVCNNYIQSHARRLRKYNKYAQEQCSGNADNAGQNINCSVDEMQGIDLRIVIEQNLSAQEYELLTQYYCDGLSLEEISHARNVSPNALRVRLHRIRKKLKEYLE